VIGDRPLETSEQVLVKWEQIKAGERARGGKGREGDGIFKELPPRLPALMFAEAVWKQIEKKGLPSGEAVDRGRVRSLGEDLGDESLGRMLFEAVAAARARGLDPEGALRRYSGRVMRAAGGGEPASRSP
jgi:XTP/dITP diphosphohydrolase/tetrapyrrole methylase family protein/MazG family protein